MKTMLVVLITLFLATGCKDKMTKPVPVNVVVANTIVCEPSTVKKLDPYKPIAWSVVTTNPTSPVEWFALTPEDYNALMDNLQQILRYVRDQKARELYLEDCIAQANKERETLLSSTNKKGQ